MANTSKKWGYLESLMKNLRRIRLFVESFEAQDLRELKLKARWGSRPKNSWLAPALVNETRNQMVWFIEPMKLKIKWRRQWWAKIKRLFLPPTKFFFATKGLKMKKKIKNSTKRGGRKIFWMHNNSSGLFWSNHTLRSWGGLQKIPLYCLLSRRRFSR